MKKKWELIKEAYDRYPKGTVFTGLGEFETYGSTGTFDFDGDDIFDLKTKGWVYYSGIWADIVEAEQKFDLLDGKVAIRVNDDYEFKALMKHYEEKGFITARERDYLNLLGRSEVWTYKEYSYRPSESTATGMGYRIVNFPDFAAHVGIDVRKPLLRSEDDVDLYEGDSFWRVSGSDCGWSEDIISQRLSRISDVIGYPNNHKAFSTREAAEAWVPDKNRPMFLELFKDGSTPVTVNREGFSIRLSSGGTVAFSGTQLEQIYAAYQKVKGGQS